MPRLSSVRGNSLESLVAQAESQLPQAGGYLDSRGIGRRMAAQFRLGYVEELGVCEGMEAFPGPALLIPYLTYNGVVAVRYRSLDEKAWWRYTQPKGSESWIYNVADVLTGPRILCLCEGEIDAMTMSFHTTLPAIAIAGTDAWKPIFAKVLESAEVVMICADGGSAGATMVDAFTKADEDKRRLANARPCQFPDGEDVNSFFLRHGAEALGDYIMERV